MLGADPGHIRVELEGVPVERRDPRAEASTRMVDLIYRIMTSPQADVETLLTKVRLRPLTGQLRQAFTLVTLHSDFLCNTSIL